MPKLSAIDQAFLFLETDERPMNVGALLVLEPPAAGRARFADRLVARMLECPVGPPFNYRVKPAAIGPFLALEEDDSVDPARHLHRHTLRKGSDLQALFARLCDLHVQRLPRDEPLWQVHVFSGLPDGRVALYFKTHHGIIDGIGFIRIVTALVSESATDRRPHAIWEGLAAAGAVGSAPAGAATPLARAMETGRTLLDLARLSWRQGRRAVGVGPGLALPFVSTPGVLETPPTSHRSLAHCRVSLPTVKHIAARGDAKVNDVMLAALDLALQRYLAERGSRPDRPLVADVPVALHDHGGAGNRITILQVPLGRPGAAPAERLRQIVDETRSMKQEVRSIAGDSLALYSIFVHTLASTIESLRLDGLPMLANLVISNPAGLERRVYFNGAAVELALPISVVAHHQVLNVTVTTYVDELHVTFIALREAVPGLERLARYTVDAVAELAAVVAPRARQRRRTVARPARRTRGA